MNPKRWQRQIQNKLLNENAKRAMIHHPPSLDRSGLGVVRKVALPKNIVDKIVWIENRYQCNLTRVYRGYSVVSIKAYEEGVVRTIPSTQRMLYPLTRSADSKYAQLWNRGFTESMKWGEFHGTWRGSPLFDMENSIFTLDSIFPTLYASNSFLDIDTAILVNVFDYLHYVDSITRGEMHVFDYLNIGALIKAIKDIYSRRGFLIHQIEEVSPERFKQLGIPSRKSIIKKVWQLEYRTFCSHEIFSRVAEDYLFNPDYFYSKMSHQNLWIKYHNVDQYNHLFKVDIDGEVVTIGIHGHTLLSTIQHDQYPDTIYVKPADFFKDKATHVLEGKIHQLRKNKAKYLSFDSLGEDEVYVKRILNYVALMNEGTLMRHCIGGNGYPQRGAAKECLFFRYIPKGITKDDYREQYTVTLHQGGQVEISGYRNRTPDSETRKDFDAFLERNKEVFKFIRDDFRGDVSTIVDDPEDWSDIYRQTPMLSQALDERIRILRRTAPEGICDSHLPQNLSMNGQNPLFNALLPRPRTVEQARQELQLSEIDVSQQLVMDQLQWDSTDRLMSVAETMLREGRDEPARHTRFQRTRLATGLGTIVPHEETNQPIVTGFYDLGKNRE